MFVLQLAGNRPRPRQMRKYAKPTAAILATVAVIVGAGIAGGFALGGKSANKGNETATLTTPSTSSQAETLPATTTQASTTSPASADPLARAKAVLAARGYSATNDEQYAPNANLRVLVGRSNSTPPRERVFFFLGDHRWLGFDAKEPSGQLAVTHQDGRVVQVAYSLYRPGDTDANPSGGSKTVSFRWNGEKLVPLDEIPTSDSSAPLSRR